MPSALRVRTSIRVLATLVAIAALPAAPAAAVHWKNAARIGQPVAGLPSGEVLRSIGFNLLSVRSGKVVFNGTWGPPPVKHAFFEWTEQDGLAEVLTLDASPISVGGTTFSLATSFQIGDFGGTNLIAFDRDATVVACPNRASLDTEDVSFIENGAGGFTAAVAPGMPVPGIEPGWIFSAGASNGRNGGSYGAPASNADGDLAFFSWIARTTNVCDGDAEVAYATALLGPDGAGSYTLAALDEDPAPEAGDGAALIVDFGIVELNGAGEIAFDPDVRLGPSGPTIPTIYRWDALNGLRLVTLSYERGLLGENGFHLGEGGHVAFVNFLGTALFVEDVANGVELRVAAGDPAPGLPAGFTLAELARPADYYPGGRSPAYTFAVNALGDVAFSGRADPGGAGGVSRYAVWGPDASGALTLRMVDGQDAPGVEGATIDASDRPPNLIAMSDQRELLIAATLAGPEPTPRDVYYLIDADGNAQILLRSGDGLAFAPGDFEAVQSGGPSSFDADLDHFAFLAHSVTNREAIFYGQVPEVGGTAAGLAAVVSLCTLRTRRRVA